MAESDWLIVGLLIGIPVGVCLGFLIAQMLQKRQPSTVLFTRDKETGYITEIHYVPIGEAKP